ncbi:hypothetical protein TrispH2_006475 [Trichoplax sp. H2]|uniref:Uncharacterized protein n=1 Tax=Trichoplax adhaerens TaxID=10228 RepID=B3S2E0_TRIAD|nr:predicted protein [Trichoplax adhaerens]EDV23082.1 predicted protein [Trichoplax adhaerens]RDD41321.1 hypothetical protein TrispH2_006475 [Trichoplax sp. H2]|eukprot:XP_002113992.1 predicted protein [Trichoplax adhaerens]
MALSSIDIAQCRNKGEHKQLCKKLSDIEKQEHLKSRQLLKDHQDLKFQLMRMKSSSSISRSASANNVRLPKLPHTSSNGQINLSSKATPTSSPQHSPMLRRKNIIGQVNEARRPDAPAPNPMSPSVRRRVFLSEQNRASSESDLFNMKRKKDPGLISMKELAMKLNKSYSKDSRLLDTDKAYEQLITDLDRLRNDDRDEKSKDLNTRGSASTLYSTDDDDNSSYGEGLNEVLDQPRKLGPLAKTYVNSPILQRKLHLVADCKTSLNSDVRSS